jgi:aldose 1-epimerase
MKKKILSLTAILVFTVMIISCNNNTDKTGQNDKPVADSSLLLAKAENFSDTLNGKQVKLYYLKNDGIEASITNYGGRVGYSCWFRQL